jgi:uncharacterized protein (TIGR02996 family)
MRETKSDRSDEMIFFFQAIAAKPEDETCRLVFADWLEERGDARAEFLRVDSALATEQASDERRAELRARWAEFWATLPGPWQTVLGRSLIENCRPSRPVEDFRLRFKFQCPKKWDNLNPTKEGAVRFCACCNRSVYYCHSVDEAKEHAGQGHCVAVKIGIRRSPGDLDEEAQLELGEVGS